jgi:hypothetical protein
MCLSGRRYALTNHAPPLQQNAVKSQSTWIHDPSSTLRLLELRGEHKFCCTLWNWMTKALSNGLVITFISQGSSISNTPWAVVSRSKIVIVRPTTLCLASWGPKGIAFVSALIAGKSIYLATMIAERIVAWNRTFSLLPRIVKARRFVLRLDIRS